MPGGLFRSNDHGQSWALGGGYDDPGIHTIRQTPPTRIGSPSPSPVAESGASADAGASYDLVYRHALEVDATGERLAMGSTTGHLWTSGDGGQRWTLIGANLPPIAQVSFA